MEKDRSRDDEEGIDEFYLGSMLQGALSLGIIKGWNGPVEDCSFIITPCYGDSKIRSKEYVIGFCELLAMAGVEQNFNGLDS